MHSSESHSRQFSQPQPTRSFGQGVDLLQQLALLLALHHLSQGGVAGDGLRHIALLLIGLLLGARVLPLLLHLLQTQSDKSRIEFRGDFTRWGGGGFLHEYFFASSP